MSEQQFYGWFEDASTAKAYDPPHDGPCLYCGKPFGPDDVRTHSIMAQGEYAARSYFYRTHRTCDDLGGQDIDAVVWAMIERNGD